MIFDHPDNIIAALEREKQLNPHKAAEIDIEIARVDARVRPPVRALTSNGEPVVDHRQAYIEGLKRELKLYPDKKEQIEAEIERVTVAQRPIERAVSRRRFVSKAVTNTDAVTPEE